MIPAGEKLMKAFIRANSRVTQEKSGRKPAAKSSVKWMAA